MATGNSVTVSFRLNLNREEDFEILKYLYGEGIKNSFGGKSKFIKDALLKVLRGMKRDEENNRLVCELNAGRDEFHQAMTGEADRIINAVKLIVEEQVKGLTVKQMVIGSTAGITDNGPERGIYREGFRGNLLPLTRFCKTHCVLRIWQILSTQVLEAGRLEELPMTCKEKEMKEGIAYRTKRTIDRAKEEFYHPIVG